VRKWQLTLCGMASIGDLVSVIYRFKTTLTSTKQTSIPITIGSLKPQLRQAVSHSYCFLSICSILSTITFAFVFSEDILNDF
jgi:hypothetical protein